MLIYGYIPKSKKRKVSRAKLQQHEDWLKSLQAIQPKTTKIKSKKNSLTEYLVKVPAGRETPKIASLDTGFITCTKIFGNSYTGDKMKGVATMHKSNAVPVFTDKEAKEISSMRR